MAWRKTDSLIKLETLEGDRVSLTYCIWLFWEWLRMLSLCDLIMRCQLCICNYGFWDYFSPYWNKSLISRTLIFTKNLTTVLFSSKILSLANDSFKIYGFFLLLFFAFCNDTLIIMMMLLKEKKDSNNHSWNSSVVRQEKMPSWRFSWDLAEIIFLSLAYVLHQKTSYISWWSLRSQMLMKYGCSIWKYHCIS